MNKNKNYNNNYNKLLMRKIYSNSSIQQQKINSYINLKKKKKFWK